MKSLAVALLALAALSTAASAQYCPPGQGYRNPSYGVHRPTQTQLPRPIEAPQAPAATPEAPTEPAPTEPVPQK